ncbi:MAG: ATP-dependent helicase [Candidatus Bipolaricaulota bacterium]|nr:ATP-dependent helicase [Candidatus Bipolaricaulota bacterium]
MSKKADELSWLDELNPQQHAAVTHGDGPLLVVAGAGTGKTKTLAYRVTYLISRGVNPGKILLLTFTRRAAQEMLQRASRITERGTPVTGRVWGGTFHATANRLLRIYASAAGISKDFTILDQGDAEDLIGMIRHEMGLHSQEMRFPRKRTCLSIYSRTVNGSLPLHEVLEKHFPWCDMWEKELRSIFSQYVTRKQERNVLDYDDLLLYWAEILSSERLASELSSRFDHILVDEYQDTNPIQARILRGMRHGNDNIMVVGDDAQSIYAFRGATVRNILDFPTQFDGAKILKLEQNYRSVSPILETTNLVIAAAKQRHTKNLWSQREGGERPKLVTCKDETQQDEYVIDRVLSHYEQGIPLRKQAVLFRAGHLSDSLEIELTRRNIPYHKYGGLRFLEASHVKDLVSFLRIVENPRDEMAWFRALQLIDGIGPGTAARAVKHVAKEGNDPRAIRTFRVRPTARETLAALADVIDDIMQTDSNNPAMQIERIREFYDPLVNKLYENPAARTRDLISLEQIAAGYKSRRDFLADLQLDPPTSTSDLAGTPHRDEDWLVLSTIHSAKGCEWDVVYLIHAADGFLPSDMATGSQDEIEEELRLTYVALTRARDFLYITWPLRYYFKWYALTDSHTYAQRCRFFTDDVMTSIDEVHLEYDPGDDTTMNMDAGVDIARNIRGMWEE